MIDRELAVRLKTVRNAHTPKMTQAQLGSRIGCSEELVRHMENGERRITEDTLALLVGVFGHALVDGIDRNVASLDDAREIVRVPPARRSELEAHAEECARKLFPSLAASGQPIPVTVALTRISELAHADSPPIEIGTFTGRIEGMTWYSPPSVQCQVRASVFSDAARGDGRARMTVAHEMAHALLHWRVLVAEPGAMFRDADGLKPSELVDDDLRIFEVADWQAATWAAAFLMPVSGVRAWLRQMADGQMFAGADDLARQFQVGRTAADYRLRAVLPALASVHES